MKPFRVCTCGRAIPTLADWRALPLCGVKSEDGEVQEYRTHACGSTLVLTLIEHPSEIRERLGLEAA